MKATRLLTAFLMVLAVAAMGCSQDKSTPGDTTASSGASGASGSSGGY